MKECLRKIEKDKIKINWNKNPIKMDMFLSLLTTETIIPEGDWLGQCTGWTKRVGDGGLQITGGIVGNIEYLDHIKYGEKLDNPYNNFVNPFYLWDILTSEGKRFFLEYYADDIKSIIEDTSSKLKQATKAHDKTSNFWKEMGAGSQANDT